MNKKPVLRTLTSYVRWHCLLKDEHFININQILKRRDFGRFKDLFTIKRFSRNRVDIKTKDLTYEVLQKSI